MEGFEGMGVEGVQWPAAPSWVWREQSGEAGYCEETRTYVATWRGPNLGEGVDGVAVYVEQQQSARDGLVLSDRPTIAVDMLGEDYQALSIDQARVLRDTLSEAIADAEQVDATV
ncbi:hypothetical protein ACWELP_28135 [Rhodococcus aetherivorans]